MGLVLPEKSSNIEIFAAHLTSLRLGSIVRSRKNIVSTTSLILTVIYMILDCDGVKSYECSTMHFSYFFNFSK